MPKSYQNKEILLFVAYSNFWTGKRHKTQQNSVIIHLTEFGIALVMLTILRTQTNCPDGSYMRFGRSQRPSWNRSKIYSFLSHSRFWHLPVASPSQESPLPHIHCGSPHKSKMKLRTSLVVQELIICLPMQGTWAWSLVQEDTTCCGTTKAMHHSYWGLCA